MALPKNLRGDAEPHQLRVPGLTMARALTYLPGREQLFERVLRQFASLYQPGIAGLSAALAAHDWQQVSRLLHALRGACGAIGATDLLARSAALEQALAPQALAAPSNGAEPADAVALAAQARQIEHDLMALVSLIQARLGSAPAGPA